MMNLTTNETVALFDLDEVRVRKEVEHGVLTRTRPPRFDLPAIVYLRALGELGLEVGAVTDRKRLYELIRVAIDGDQLTIMLSAITEVRLATIVRDVSSRVRRFMAWKERLVTDDQILGGEPVFPRTRLAVRQIGGLSLRGVPASELREDYPYLKDEDIEFAGLYARAYPRMGRPRGDQAAAR